MVPALLKLAREASAPGQRLNQLDPSAVTIDQLANSVMAVAHYGCWANKLAEMAWRNPGAIPTSSPAVDLDIDLEKGAGGGSGWKQWPEPPSPSPSQPGSRPRSYTSP